MYKRNIFLLFFGITISFPGISVAQTGQEIRDMISRYKEDPKGPYKDIRWFCKDGTILPPQERCSDPGGIQRARYKDELVRLSETRHVFIGQILAGTAFEDFWDEENQQARLKQYQFELFLKNTDNQWVWKKAQFYRGALQAEDEEKWGMEFYKWLLAQPGDYGKKFFLIRQSVRDIPHTGDNQLTREIRALSKDISDAYAPFLNLRVKIHGQPDSTDFASVKSFMAKHEQNLTVTLKEKGSQLLKALETQYLPVNEGDIQKLIKRTTKNPEINQNLHGLLESYLRSNTASSKIQTGSELLWQIRLASLQITDPLARLDLLDLSVYLESQLLSQSSYWNTADLRELIQKISSLSKGLAGTGFLEIWEWDAVKDQLLVDDRSQLSLKELNLKFRTARNIVQWGTLMIRANYQSDISRFAEFSDKISSVSDDWIRSSLLLSLGDAVSSLGDFISEMTNTQGQLFGTINTGSVRGLNPGFAKAELVVVDENDPIPDLGLDKIYVFHHPPSDMKPVAGIATSSEGNLVSHVQLLARNLGIPNALITADVFPLLKKYSGQQVFYAVSPANVVVMKSADKMTTAEKQLFETSKRNTERVHVPVKRIDLSTDGLIDLSGLDASSSGILCGPKAANLGELKKLFPDHVVNGIVIPFGVFKKHMDQLMPGSKISYWNFLLNGFAQADLARSAGVDEAEIEQELLALLAKLSSEIKKIPFLPGFNTEIQQTFQKVFGKRIGTIPVFLRSDTNMEDLKDFTGAGLNLTLFNVVEEANILQGIREVWASPYTERSFRWRQLFLDNPENVFPSILIIPSVNVDCSGVMITRLVGEANKKGLTMAFSRGAGGAVEGQVAESYWVFENGSDMLISPAREPFFNSLPSTGGTLKTPATFEKSILNLSKIKQLEMMALNIKTLLKDHSNSDQDYDIELGFLDNKIWLFQIRPFVENKNARSSQYLASLNPVIDETKIIPLSTRIQ